MESDYAVKKICSVSTKPTYKFMVKDKGLLSGAKSLNIEKELDFCLCRQTKVIQEAD